MKGEVKRISSTLFLTPFLFSHVQQMSQMCACQNVLSVTWRRAKWKYIDTWFVLHDVRVMIPRYQQRSHY